MLAGWVPDAVNLCAPCALNSEVTFGFAVLLILVNSFVLLLCSLFCLPPDALRL